MDKKPKILVIDDNPEIVEEILPEYGFDKTVARDGQKGLDVINERVR